MRTVLQAARLRADRFYGIVPAVSRRLLINEVVRRAAKLVVALASDGDTRTPLVGITDVFFRALSDELNDRDVSRKVAADMFGLSLRAYQLRLRKPLRATESETLWNQVRSFVQQAGTISRADVLVEFARRDHDIVASILRDMVNLGAATLADGSYAIVASPPHLSRGMLRLLIWTRVFEHPSNLPELTDSLPASEAEIRAELAALQAEDVIQLDSTGQYRSERLVIEPGSENGRLNALFDHYAAAIDLLVAKLNGESEAGGTTLRFDLSNSHRYADQVRGLLKAHRQQLWALWQEVADHNESLRAGGTARFTRQVAFYFGQLETPLRPPSERVGPPEGRAS